MTMDCYAVMGNPIHQSKSPIIHQAFAQQEQQSIQYEAKLIDIEEGAFEADVKRFFSEGGRGLSVTVPFKEIAWKMSEIRSPAAEKAGAVNTLSYNPQLGKLLGDNTDGLGLVRDLVRNQGVELEGKRVLILGAGGAVRGVLGPLIEHSPAIISLANRTASKAESLAALFSDLKKIHVSAYQDLPNSEPFDVIINGTSASLQGEIPPLDGSILAASSVCYDMMYGAKPTVFNQWASHQGCERTYDGLGMLVEQAAEAYYIWRGFTPDTQSVIESVRKQMIQS